MDALLADLTALGERFPALRATAIVVVFLGGAWIAEIVLARWVGRLVQHTASDVDDQLVALVRRPVFLTVTCVGLDLAARSLDLSDGVVLFTSRALRTLLLLVWLGFALRFCSILLHALSRQGDRFSVVEDSTVPLFDNLARVVLVGLAVYIALRTWSIDATAWLTSAGILGIALGFAAKDTLANLFSGIFILADRPYKIGDFVILDSGERGRVTGIGIRSSRLLTRDDIEITIPNAVIANAKIINESGGPWEKERIRLKIGVAYGSDVDKVCTVLEAIAAEHEHVCLEPAPRVRFRQFGDSSLDFELLAWIDEPVLRGRMVHELNMAIYKTFAREGIEIPFPQRDVWVRSAEGPVGDTPQADRA